MRIPLSGSTLTLAAAVLLLTGCPQDIAISLRDGSTVRDLVFILSRGHSGRPTTFSMFLVQTCTSASFGNVDEYWRITASDNSVPVTEMRFGVTPQGYNTVRAPRQLAADECYSVSAAGKADLYMVADSSGRVSEITKEEAMRIAAR